MKAPRRILAALVLSAAGLVGIVAHEGYSDKPIVPVKGDVLTLGFGTTGGIKPDDRTTPPKALARAMLDIQSYEGALKRCVVAPLYQHEYDAFVSLAYNIGPTAFCKSTLVKKLNAGDYAGACAEIRRWTWFNGKDCNRPENKCSGLANRRESEYRQCAGQA